MPCSKVQSIVHVWVPPYGSRKSKREERTAILKQALKDGKSAPREPQACQPTSTLTTWSISASACDDANLNHVPTMRGWAGFPIPNVHSASSAHDAEEEQRKTASLFAHAAIVPSAQHRRQVLSRTSIKLPKTVTSTATSQA